ncbi:hypothetical protein BKA66DRAFT_567128 [Pyrenochaeta sp. MPI-SDFR-AT-0127]|nr:hypothetical protein BKA66DRAFT_567128 [Pyrenochaeta sp. MPI-SDFR-AT-0127]
MSRTLRRDTYSLCTLGYLAERIKPPDPETLAALRYLCIYWIDHLCDWNPSSSAEDKDDLQDGGTVDSFLRERYFYWLEALSLCKSMSKGVVSIAKLEVFMQGRTGAHALYELVRDARRFIMSYKWAIEKIPLQAYASALLFSPNQSLIRGLFKREEPNWMTIKSDMDNKWSPCLSTLEGHSFSVHSVAFSHDSAWVASASWDDTVKIWDAHSGQSLSTLSIDKTLHRVSFDISGSYLHADIGTIDISDLSGSVTLPTISEPCSPQYQGLALSADSVWITYNLENIIWLPSEYRPLCLAVLRNAIVIGVVTGRVWIRKVKRNRS